MKNDRDLKKIDIAYQGAPGAYSEAALHALCNVYGITEYTPVPVNRFDEGFEYVAKGALGCFPIENIITGSVVPTYDCIVKDQKIEILAEYILPINHEMMSVLGASLESITQVYSHPQALLQCRPYLEKNGYEAQTYFDTAGAAAFVRDANNVTKAALASPWAAEVYGLEVIAQDLVPVRNMTRFHLFTSRDHIDGDFRTQITDHALPDTTSLIITTRDIPAALYKALGGFASNGVNLLKIESRPHPEKPFTYMFWIDHEGIPSDAHVKNAHEELAFFAQEMRIVGSYSRMRGK